MSISPSDLESVMQRVRSRSGHPVGPQPSDADRALITLLGDHVANEAAVLHAWDELAARAPEPHVRYIAGLIVEDERVHHALLAEMLERVRSDAQWQTTEPGIPWVRAPKDRQALLFAIENLERVERSDLRRVRALRRRLRAQRRTSLLWALADLLESDTRKHLRLLKFLRRAARP